MIYAKGSQLSLVCVKSDVLQSCCNCVAIIVSIMPLVQAARHPGGGNRHRRTEKRRYNSNATDRLAECATFRERHRKLVPQVGRTRCGLDWPSETQRFALFRSAAKNSLGATSSSLKYNSALRPPQRLNEGVALAARDS